MALPIVEHFNVEEQDYSIEVPVDSHVNIVSDNAVESDAVQSEIDLSTIPDQYLKQPKKVSMNTLLELLHAVGHISEEATVEEAIQALAYNGTDIVERTYTKLLTSGGAYADKVSVPSRSSKNITCENLAAFFMNSPTPESWLGKVMGTKLGKTLVTVNGTSNMRVYGVYASDGMFIACMGESAALPSMYWSYDGFTWTKGSTSDTFSTSYNEFAALHVGNLWVIGTNSTGTWWSTDGKSWIKGTIGSRWVYDIQYADGLWVAATNDGPYWSSDGKNWTKGNTDYSGSDFFRVVAYHAGHWMAGGFWSSDGKNWYRISILDSVRDIAYGNGVWVVADSRGIWWSSDGISGTRGNPAIPRLLAVYYANGMFVAGGYAYQGEVCGIWWSTDGKNWTQGTGVDAAGGFVGGVLFFANGMWLAGSTVGCYWSNDGKHWNLSAGTVNVPIRSIFYHRGVWLIGGGSYYYSEMSGNGLYRSSVKDLGYA